VLYPDELTAAWSNFTRQHVQHHSETQHCQYANARWK